MPSPIGEATYKGLAVPAFGDSVIEQENSSNAILTLVHTSANAGSFIQGMDFRADRASSLLTDLALWDVDVDGGFRVLSGTSVLFELNSSGLYQGTTQIINASGIFNGPTAVQTVTTVSSASGSTIISLTTAQSGRLIIVDGGAQGAMVVLPTPTAGLNYTIYQSSAHPGVVDVTSTGGAFDISFPTGNTTLASTAQAAAPFSTIGGYSAKFTAISASRWLCQPTINVLTGTSATGEASGGWVAGTTVA